MFSLLLAGKVHALCGDGTRESSEQCDDGNLVTGDGCDALCRLTCEAVNDPMISHTCGHGTHGPFVSLGAQSYPGFIYTDISASHTYFTLTLSGEPGANRSGVIYAPGITGVYAFFLKEPYAFSIYDSEDAEVPLLMEHAVTCVGSDSLTWVKVYQLGTSFYDVVFGPTQGALASVAVEFVGDRNDALYWDRDGDGRGGDLRGAGWCRYDDLDPNLISSLSRSTDCDDDDPAIHAGATELCDGKDNDCSGDGDVGAEGLCDEDADGAACIEAGEVTRCGCARDTDCERGASCNVAAQRCERISGSGGASGASGDGGTGEEGGAGGERGRVTGGTGGTSGTVPGGTVAGASGDTSDAGHSGMSDESGGTSGTAATAGSAGSGGGAGRAGAAGAASAGAPETSDSGCGCRAATSNPTSAGLGVLGAVFLGFVRRRRSRLEA